MQMRVEVPQEIQKAVKKQLRYILSKLPPDTGVAIFISPIDKGDTVEKDADWVLYMSNVERNGMLKIVSQLIQAEGN